MSNRRRPLIYVDSSVLLDLITDEKTLIPGSEVPRGAAAEAILRGIEEGKAQFATSALVELEVYAAPRVRKNAVLVDQVREALEARFSDPETMWCDIDRVVAGQALDLATEMKPPHAPGHTSSAADIGHLAAAVRMGCTHFMTTDQGFPIDTDIRSTRIMFPEPVWAAELF